MKQGTCLARGTSHRDVRINGQELKLSILAVFTSMFWLDYLSPGTMK